MPRIYSKSTQVALSLLGKQIQLLRKRKKWTAQNLAERAGITRGTVHKIEKGDPKCEIGLAFELAMLVGVPLFEAALSPVDQLIRTEDRIALLPKAIRPKHEVVDDNF